MSSWAMLRVVLVTAFRVALTGVALTGVASIGAAQAQVSPQLAQKAPEAAAIAAAAAAGRLRQGHRGIRRAGSGAVAARPAGARSPRGRHRGAARRDHRIAFRQRHRSEPGPGISTRSPAVRDHPDVRGQCFAVGIERFGGRSRGRAHLLRPPWISCPPPERPADRHGSRLRRQRHRGSPGRRGHRYRRADES